MVGHPSLRLAWRLSLIYCYENATPNVNVKWNHYSASCSILSYNILYMTKQDFYKPPYSSNFDPKISAQSILQNFGGKSNMSSSLRITRWVKLLFLLTALVPDYGHTPSGKFVYVILWRRHAVFSSKISADIVSGWTLQALQRGHLVYKVSVGGNPSPGEHVAGAPAHVALCHVRVEVGPEESRLLGVLRLCTGHK